MANNFTKYFQEELSDIIVYEKRSSVRLANTEDKYYIPPITITTPKITFDASKLPTTMIQTLSWRGLLQPNSRLLPQKHTVKVMVPEVFFSSPSVKCFVVSASVKDEVAFGGLALSNPYHRSRGDLSKSFQVSEYATISRILRADGTYERSIKVELTNRSNDALPGYDIVVRWEASCDTDDTTSTCYPLGTLNANEILCPCYNPCATANTSTYPGHKKQIGSFIKFPQPLKKYVIDQLATYCYDILTLTGLTTSGSVVVTLLKNNIAVPGIENVTFTDVEALYNVSEPVTINPGDKLSLIIMSNPDSVELNFNLTLK
jgi:hypothetical protein